MRQKPDKISLSDKERQNLEVLAESHYVEDVMKKRAHIILLASKGNSNNEISKTLGVSRPTVILWRKRFNQKGLRGLEDVPRNINKSVNPDVYRNEARILHCIAQKPRWGMYWTIGDLEDEFKIGKSFISRTLARHRVDLKSKRYSLPLPVNDIVKKIESFGLYINKDKSALLIRLRTARRSNRKPKPFETIRKEISVENITKGLFLRLIKSPDSWEFYNDEPTNRLKWNHPRTLPGLLPLLDTLHETGYKNHELFLIMQNFDVSKYSVIKKWIKDHKGIYFYSVSPTEVSWMCLVDMLINDFEMRSVLKNAKKTDIPPKSVSLPYISVFLRANEGYS